MCIFTTSPFLKLLWQGFISSSVSDWAHREQEQRPIWKLEWFSIGQTRKKTFVASRCSKSSFPLSLLWPKDLCSPWSGTRAAGLEVFSQKDELMVSVAFVQTRIWGRWELETPGIPIPPLSGNAAGAWPVVSALDILGVSESLYTGYPHGSFLL